MRGAKAVLATLMSTWVVLRVAPAGATELSVTPPVPCPNGVEVAFGAERALGRPLASVPGPDFVIAMAQQGQRYVARLESRAADGTIGERAFSAPSCGELVETLALAVAIALGASPAKAVAPDAASLSADEPALPVSASEPAEPALASSAPSPGPTLAALGWLVGDSGTLPNPAPGVALGGGVRWPAFELRATALVLPAQHGTADGLTGAAAGADIGLLAGTAQACAPLSLRTQAIELGVCAGWELGRLQATGTGVLRPYRKRTLWFAPRLDAEARWALTGSALSLNVLLTVLAPLQRDEFILKDVGSVHRPPNVVARAGVGLGWAL